MVQYAAGEGDEFRRGFVWCEAQEGHPGLEIQLTVAQGCGSGIQDRGWAGDKSLQVFRVFEVVEVVICLGGCVEWKNDKGQGGRQKKGRWDGKIKWGKFSTSAWTQSGRSQREREPCDKRNEIERKGREQRDRSDCFLPCIYTDDSGSFS